jgi:hypothetical protein
MLKLQIHSWNLDFGPSGFGGKEEWLLKFLWCSKFPKWNPTLTYNPVP